MIKNITNLGDAALYCDFGQEVNRATNLNVINFFNNLRDKNFSEITNISPSYNKLIISFDLNLTNFEKIKKKILNLELRKLDNKINKNVKIPVCCDEKYSLDSKRLESKLKISFEKILENFFSKDYFCYMTGFIAGMPFLGDINQEIRLNRLETPRVKVPKGSIGITEQFCNIYTFESPGGWNIIGNTPLNIFNKENIKNPALINPGDKVNFYKISIDEYKGWNERK